MICRGPIENFRMMKENYGSGSQSGGRWQRLSVVVIGPFVSVATGAIVESQRLSKGCTVISTGERGEF